MKDAKEYAETIGAIVVETSAKNAVNIEELFQGISKYIIRFLADVLGVLLPKTVIHFVCENVFLH